MEKWKTEQDSLFNWKISSGSSSPKAQWLISKYLERMKGNWYLKGSYQQLLQKSGSGYFSEYIITLIR